MAVALDFEIFCSKELKKNINTCLGVVITECKTITWQLYEYTTFYLAAATNQSMDPHTENTICTGRIKFIFYKETSGFCSDTGK